VDTPPVTEGGGTAAFPRDDVRIEVLGRLSGPELAQVALLVEHATENDGVRPLSEHVSLHLRYGGDARVRNVLVYVPDESAPPGGSRLAAYAHLDVTDVVEGSSAELVVDPALRGRGLGRLLVTQLLSESPDGRLRLWSHGEQPAAAALAAGLGFTRMRALWQLRRSLYSPLPLPSLAPGVGVRTFRPGADDADWVELNALAFAAHPEQGGWTLDDLRRRMAEPWFDPAGFFLATRPDPDRASGERLVGFHWTKVHGGTDPHGHDHDADADHTHEADGALAAHGHEIIGEVYVVGVRPDEQGNGLGRALTLIGLRHLRSEGLPAVLLYVDADNAPAIALYTDLGFTRWDTDVMYRM
jgi:mycothiol synthase